VPGIHLLCVSRILSFTRDVRTQRSGKTSYPDAMQYISPKPSIGGSTAGQPRQSSQCEMSLCHYGAQSKTSDNFQHFGASRHKRRTLRGWSFMQKSGRMMQEANRREVCYLAWHVVCNLAHCRALTLIPAQSFGRLWSFCRRSRAVEFDTQQRVC
jgi:hypothetical protein